MRLLYRADGGAHVGTGHLFRAIRILRELQARGPLQATLAIASEPSALRIAESAPASVVALPPSHDPLSARPELNAALLAPLLEQAAWDLLVVDMLDTPGREMAALAARGVPILTFDDRGPGRLHARTIINILVTEPAPSSLPPGAHLLEGPEFAVLDPVYREARCSYGRPAERLRRVLVAMGGADAAGLTVKVASALRRVPGIETVAFATGPAFPHRDALDKALVDAPWEPLVYVGLPNLLEQYRAADLSIVAGGLTMYEVCCVGVPSLAVCQSIDHQLELSQHLAAAGAMRTLGYGEDVSPEDIADAVRAMAETPDDRRAMTAAGPSLVDGRGTTRVCDALIDTARREKTIG